MLARYLLLRCVEFMIIDAAYAGIEFRMKVVSGTQCSKS